MVAKNFIRFALVSLLTLTLVFLMVPMAFATESDTADTAVTEAVTDAVTEAVTEEVASADSTAADTDDAVAAPETGADFEEISDEKSEETDAASETGDTDTTGTATEEEKDGITTGDIVSIVIVAVIVIGAAIYCIKNKAKVAEFFRNVKSECKKIVWTPWKTVRKNTFVVVIIVIVCAIVIGALDFIFAKGIVSLGDLF